MPTRPRASPPNELMGASGMNPEEVRRALHDPERLGIAGNTVVERTAGCMKAGHSIYVEGAPRRPAGRRPEIPDHCPDPR